MPLDTAAQVRLRLNDVWRRGTEVQYGDGTASSFQLAQGHPHSVIISATASVVGVNGWSATGGTFDTAQGYVEFSGVVQVGTAVRFDYLWAVFGEDELALLTAAGSVNAAVLQGVHILMGNAWKRARWAAPDGSTYDDTQAMNNLVKWRSALRAEAVEDLGPVGGLESWAEEQEHYE